MAAQQRDYRELLVIVAVVLAWGSTFAAIKVGLEAAPPILFAGLRALIGGAVMAVLAGFRSGPPRLAANARDYSVLTVLNVVAFFGLQTLGLLELASGLAAVLTYLQPVLVGVIAWRLLGESMTPAKVAGLLLGFAGIVVVSAGAFAGHVSGLGVGYAAGGAVAWALGTIVQAGAAARRRVVGGGGAVPGRRCRAHRGRARRRRRHDRLGHPFPGRARLRRAGRHGAGLDAVVQPGRGG
jgi:drug/metabolite transporter (DMT)-like permease